MFGLTRASEFCLFSSFKTMFFVSYFFLIFVSFIKIGGGEVGRWGGEEGGGDAGGDLLCLDCWLK